MPTESWNADMLRDATLLDERGDRFLSRCAAHIRVLVTDNQRLRSFPDSPAFAENLRLLMDWIKTGETPTPGSHGSTA